MEEIHAFLGTKQGRPLPLPVADNTRSTRRRSYVTLLTTESFFPGVKALHSSLTHTTSLYPLLVLVTPNISLATRHAVEQFAVIQIVDHIVLQSPLDNNNKLTDTPSWLPSGLTKLHIWRLVAFEKVVYIDADCLVVSNVDNLFEEYTLPSSFPLAAAPDIFPPDRFNAGVLVISPSEEMFNTLVAKIPSTYSYDNGDTGFLNACFPDWYSSSSHCRLPFRYNAQRTMYWFTHEKNKEYWESLKPLKIIHYSSSPKPWECPGKAAGVGGDLEWMWWQVYLGTRFNLRSHCFILY